jgi:hypothetical protein
MEEGGFLPAERKEPYWRVMPVVLLTTLVLGVFEAVYGQPGYSADSISYLDIVRALQRGDWKLALSPYWGLGYPLLLSGWLRVFPGNAVWEWVGIHCMNVLILVAACLCFYQVLVESICIVQGRERLQGTAAERFLMWAVLPIFLTSELTMDSVARVGPDALVSCLVFAAVWVLLRLYRRPTPSQAALLGLVLGAGYVVKAFFLPLSLVYLAIALLVLWRRKAPLSWIAVPVATMAVLAVPYAAGLSWAFGHPTFGESGALNYSWLVNHLQMDILWTGGPAGYGAPVHGPTQVMETPHLFLFDRPEPVTYPPWFNPPEFYRGYRRFFSLKLQFAATGESLMTFAELVLTRFVLYVLLGGLILRIRRRRYGREWKASLLRIWPLLLAAAAGPAIYFLVYTEDRYVASFVALLLMALAIAMAGFDDGSFEEALPKKWRAGLLALLLLAFGGTLFSKPRNDALNAVLHFERHELFYNYDQWILSHYLLANGIHAGDKVAEVAVHNDGNRCTWAYLDHLKIIGQVGGEKMIPQPDDLDAFWHTSTEVQRQRLEIFRQAGARAVVAFHVPGAPNLTGWEEVPGTEIWVYRFPDV